MLKHLLLFLLCFSPLFGSLFEERLSSATPGDYLVVEGGKMITLLSVRTITPNSLILEEISAPTQNLKQIPVSWKEWVASRAPGHTSWSAIEIERKTGEILECYSFSRATWIPVTSKESLIATLMQLPIQKVPDEKRKKIGPPPQAGEMDLRKPWQPAACFEGKSKERILCDVYETSWPDDGSPLSGNTIQLYFDRTSHFPLPLWIQIDATAASFSMKTLDAGQHLTSPHRTFPKRSAKFIRPPQKTKEGITLFVNFPKYFTQFDLYAIDTTEGEKQICSVTPSSMKKEAELLTLFIANVELENALEPNHRYTWMLCPKENASLFAETTASFMWEKPTPQ